MEVYYSPIGPKKAQNDLQKAKNKKRQESKILQNESDHSI